MAFDESALCSNSLCISLEWLCCVVVLIAMHLFPGVVNPWPSPSGSSWRGRQSDASSAKMSFFTHHRAVLAITINLPLNQELFVREFTSLLKWVASRVRVLVGRWAVGDRASFTALLSGSATCCVTRKTTCSFFPVLSTSSVWCTISIVIVLLKKSLATAPIIPVKWINK